MFDRETIQQMTAQELIDNAPSVIEVFDTVEKERIKADFIIRAGELRQKKLISDMFLKLERENRKHEKRISRITGGDGGEISLATQQLDLGTVEAALDYNQISVRFNRMTKVVEVSGLPEQYSKENGLSTLPILLLDWLKAQGVKGVTKAAIENYLLVIGDMQRFNPIRDYLFSSSWDGDDRLPELYEMMGVTNKLHQSYIKKWLIQCVALGICDTSKEVSADGVLVLQGKQGRGKTAFFRNIVPSPDFFVEGATLDLRDKDTIIRAIGGWICELGELDSTLKREQAALKAFITAPSDTIRIPYAAARSKFPRMTSFCGTVNPEDFLRDESGSRRFWTVPVDNMNIQKILSISREWRDQLWFQMVRYWMLDDEAFRLSKEEIEQVQSNNARFNVPLQYEPELREKLLYDLNIDKWTWWRSAELTNHYLPGADARKVGKAMARVSDAVYNEKLSELLYGADEEVKQELSKLSNRRTVHGNNEFLLPLLKSYSDTPF